MTLKYREISYNSPCKFNLFLDVIDRRQDGFHEIVSVIEPLSLSDELHLRETSGLVDVFSDHPGVPNGPENIVYQAARLIQEEAGIKKGVVIKIRKRVPVAAGLGGGSANAALTLRVLNTLWEINFPPQTLINLGARIGSDVPFFLFPTTSLCRGRGEDTISLPPSPTFWSVLINPGFPIPTRWAYEQLRISGPRPPNRNLKKIIRALKNSDLNTLGNSLYNIFQDVLEPKFTALHKILDFFRNNQTLGTVLSGSGPTVVGLVETEPEAKILADRARDFFPEGYVVIVTTNTCSVK